MDHASNSIGLPLNSEGVDESLPQAIRNLCPLQQTYFGAGTLARHSALLFSTRDGGTHSRQQAIPENITRNTMNQIEATHREISNKRIRELENLAQQIAESRRCECPELDHVMERFELLRSSLLPWLIREQCLLLPALRQRIQAHKNGAAYLEAYHGEFADMVRTAEADHNHLQMLADELYRDVTKLASKGFCSNKVKLFAEVLDELVECLTVQFQLEDAILLPCFDAAELQK